MSITGRTIDGIAAVILTGLEGHVITGTGTPSITLTLAQGDDERDPVIGDAECANGGVAVWYAGGSTTGMNAPNTTGGRVQRFWEHNYRVRVSFSVEGFPGDTINDNVASLVRQIVNQVEATLEPQSGGNYNVMRLSLREPQRHGTVTGYYVIELTVTLREAWERS